MQLRNIQLEFTTNETTYIFRNNFILACSIIFDRQPDFYVVIYVLEMSDWWFCKWFLSTLSLIFTLVSLIKNNGSYSD